MKKLTFLLGLLCSLSVLAFTEKILPIKGQVFSYYSNHILSEKNSAITDAVIVVHGSERNADRYFSSILAMATKRAREQSTFIISPHFKNQWDTLLPRELNFTDEGWLSGDQSLSNLNVSAFDVIDEFIYQLGSKTLFPNLKTITLTGHSAGGQLTQRFAVSSLAPNILNTIKFRYVVLNPGSYLYLNGKRPILPQGLDFKIPEKKFCRYNDYKYGMENLNTYFKRENPSKLINQYLNREVIYLIGEKDIDPNIDQSCAGSLQGPNRNLRAKFYKNFLDREYPEHIHDLIYVPEVAHTQHGMYTSQIGSDVIFN